MSHIIKKYASAEADKRLVSVNGRLMVMSKSANVWSPKEMVVTPSHERYTTAATYATYASNEMDKINSYMNVADGQVLTANMRSIFAAKTVNSWKDGHKASFMYWDRGYKGNWSNLQWGDESSADPWFIANLAANPTADQYANTVGCGGSWQALYFNLYALPLYRCSTKGVFLRIYNPSFVAWDWKTANVVPSSYLDGRLYKAPSSSSIRDGASKMQYNIFGELPTPSTIDTEGDASVKIEFANASISNQGHVNCNLENNNIGHYQPWNGTTVGETNRGLGSHCCPYYHIANSSDDYYVELAMTDEKKNKLMSLQDHGYGGFWLVIGPVIKDYFSSNLFPGNCTMMYFSRVELFLRLSLSSFNT